MEKHQITWRGVTIEITFTPNEFGMVDHIELRTENKTPLPVTGTGYRSHFINAGTVKEHGGAVGGSPFAVVKSDGFGFYHNLINLTDEWLALKLHKRLRPQKAVELEPHLEDQWPHRSAPAA